jgi:hypothetical protein
VTELIPTRTGETIRRPGFSAGDVLVYRVCEQLSEGLIYFFLFLGPWWFGATQKSSIAVFNCAGYALGLLLAVKFIIRALRGYQPPRWPAGVNAASGFRNAPSRSRVLIVALAALTLLLLGYCLASAVNARATFDDHTLTFQYRDNYIAWLPHSFDAVASWSAFRMYLGLACLFWALRDWLRGESAEEEKLRWQTQAPGEEPGGQIHRIPRAHALPDRLTRLLWLVAMNGALLGLEGISQKLAGSPRLLFLIKPRIHQTAAEQFGPYAYRSNGAQYLNLAWPAAVGLWWVLQRQNRSRSKRSRLALFGAGVMAAGAMISGSRGGALVATGLIVAILVVFGSLHWFGNPRRRPHQESQRNLAFGPLLWSMGLAVAAGLGLGWEALAPRMAALNSGFEDRQELYRAARVIAADFPLFGTGPGTFETVSYLYPRPDRFWPPQLHNDWLETRVTFGWTGSALLAAAFACVLLHLVWRRAPGIDVGRPLPLLICLALAGCLLHARFDFPLQVHSILALFLAWCAALCTLPPSGRYR